MWIRYLNRYAHQIWSRFGSTRRASTCPCAARHRAEPFCRRQHDPGAPNHLPRRVAIRNQPLKPSFGRIAKTFGARLSRLGELQTIRAGIAGGLTEWKNRSESGLADVTVLALAKTTIPHLAAQLSHTIS